MLADIWSRLLAGRPSRSTVPIKVLIVDDDPSVCQYVDRVLHDCGYVTTVAFDGPEALAKAKTEGPFDLLLTDEVMPQLRGHELASHVRQLDPDVKVLYLTGYSDLLFTDRGALWDGEAFVDKPVTPQALREAISLLLSGHTL